MSGRMLTIKTADGDYEVPEENAAAAMKLLDAKGVKFDMADLPHEAPAAVDSTPQPTAAPEKPWYQALAETGNDAAAGLAHGATMHADNLLPGQREVNDRSLERSPYAFTAAETVGGAVPNMLMSGAGMVGSAGKTAADWASRLGANVVQGMVQGGVRGYSDANPDASQSQKLEQAATSAEEQGGFSGLIHTGVSGLAELGSKMAGGVANTFGRGANSARAKAYGVGSDELAARAQESGTSVQDATAALVREGERLAPPNRLAPIDPAGYNQRFRGAANGLNSDIEGSINQATRGGAQLPADPRFEATRGLDYAADNAMRRGTGDNAKLAGALQSEAAASSMGEPLNGPFGVRDMKIELDKGAYKGAPGSPESFAGQAAKTHADQYRGMLNDYVQQGAPDAYPGFRGASDDYGIAATLRDSTGALDARQQAAGGFLPKAIGGAVGAAGGYMMGGTPGALAGGAAGYGVGGMANNAMRGVSSPYMPDLGANVGRGIEGMAQTAQGAQSWIAREAPTGAATAQALQTPKPTGAPPSASDQQQSAQGSRGHLLPQQIAKALQSAPQVLGPYAQQLSQAKDEEELDAMIERLRRTDSKFETTIVPRFQGM